MISWSARRNDIALGVLGATLPLIAKLVQLRSEHLRRRFRSDQEALRRRYRIDDGTEIRGYDAVTRLSVENFAAQHGGVVFAETSGTTSTPKRIAYTPNRFADSTRQARGCAAWALDRYAVARPSIMVLSGLQRDRSYSSLVLAPRKRSPSYVKGLLEPAGYLWQDGFSRLIESYGLTAVRLWLAIVSNPGVLYATNPSTLATFLRELHADWPASRRLVRDYRNGTVADGPLEQVFRRLAGSDATVRLRLAAHASEPPPIKLIVPALSTWSSWDGGYVRTYIEMVERYLPPDLYVHIPMYSMSTETIETLTCFDRDGEICFLPIARNVLYEFLPEEAEAEPANLVRPHELQPGALYEMVVSDAYGLKRYRTGDLFACHRLIDGLPDLRFMRRRGLCYSFTGEKLTEQQVIGAIDRLRAQVPGWDDRERHLCLFPTCQSADALPGYLLVVATPSGDLFATSELRALTRGFEAALVDINPELRTKLESRRLAPTTSLEIAYDVLVGRLSDPDFVRHNRSMRPWENQFKLLPLYTRTWQHFSPGRSAQSAWKS